MAREETEYTRGAERVRRHLNGTEWPLRDPQSDGQGGRSYFWRLKDSEYFKLKAGGRGELEPFTPEQKKELDSWYMKNRSSIRKKYGLSGKGAPGGGTVNGKA